MDNERIAAYLRSLKQTEDPFLAKLRKEALETGVPILRTDTEALLSFFTELVKPSEILELGTAIGYSGTVMLRHGNARLTTVENYAPRIERAKRTFEEAGLSERVTLIPEDAGEVLKRLSGPYDLIFLDAAKAQYVTWLPEILRLMKPGSVLIADNVFQDGNVLESRFAVRKRDRTVHERMRAFLEAVERNPDLESAVLNVGDGVSVSVLKGAMRS